MKRKTGSKTAKAKKAAKKKAASNKRASFKRGAKAKAVKAVAAKKKKSNRLSSASTGAAQSTRAPSSPAELLEEAETDESELPANQELPAEPEFPDEPQFKGFSLVGFPADALPDMSKPHGGAYSYTKHIFLRPGDAQAAGTVDILLKKRAFHIKRPAAGGRRATIAFKKHGGPTLAWQEAMRVGGFDV